MFYARYAHFQARVELTYFGTLKISYSYYKYAWREFEKHQFNLFYPHNQNHQNAGKQENSSANNDFGHYEHLNVFWIWQL